MVAEAMVMLDQRRSMEAEAARADERTVPHGTAARFWVNHTSTSTFTESYVLKVDNDQGWQVTCDKRLVNATGTSYELAPGHITPQAKQHLCEVMRLSGPLEGSVKVTLSSLDGVLYHETSLAFTFQTPPEDDGVSSIVLISGGLGFGTVLVAVTLLLMRKESDDEVKNFDATSAEMLAGPPASVEPTTALTEPEGSTTSTDSGNDVSPQGPPLPATGLPEGWTQEQWVYYGQQYLDGTL